ncbi:MAG: hypothetical protein U0893_24770 [Chloroflexota bacterium]
MARSARDSNTVPPISYADRQPPPMTANPAAPAVDPLAQHTATWLLRWIRAQVDTSRAAVTLGPPPAGVRAARPSTVVLTFYEGRKSAGFTGQGGSLLEAVMAAVANALTTPPAVRRVQLDIVEGDPAPVAKPAADDSLSDPDAQLAWQRLTSFQDGLAIAQGSTASWLVATQLQLQSMSRPDAETVGAKARDVLESAMTRLGQPSTVWQDSSIELWRFTTSAWIEDSTLEQALPLVQGIVPVTSFDRARLLAAARAGGEYLLRIQRPDGSFTYTKDPWLAVQSRTAYNIVRHAGTATALFQASAVLGEPRLLDAAQKAMAYLAGFYRDGSKPGLTYVLDKDGKAKLGAFGLALLAMTHKLDLAPQDGDREMATQIARQIVALQKPDGSFDSYLRLRGDEPTGNVSLYYPGEAMLALARLAHQGIDEGFMGAAHRGSDFLIAQRKGKRPPPDAWLIQALEVLYADAPKPSYVEHAVAISEAMLGEQFGPRTSVAYRGGIGPEPVSSTRTSARVEGLLSAVRLTQSVGDARAASLLASSSLTIPHLLQMQYDADNAFFLDDPASVHGGMRAGLDDAEIRIDYVQHYMSAMMMMAGLV